MLAISEADTCRRYITPALVDGAGWDIHEQIVQERFFKGDGFAPGRVVVVGSKARRKKGKRADYVLRYTRDLPLAVVEAKAYDVPVVDGLQQAIDYARILRLPFAYAANGREIIEHDLLTGVESRLDFFPGPNELWEQWQTAEATELGLHLAFAALPPGRLAKFGNHKARDLISGGLKRSKSYRGELADRTYSEIVRMSQGKGLAAKAAREMKKLIEQSPRLLDKRRSKPR